MKFSPSKLGAAGALALSSLTVPLAAFAQSTDANATAGSAAVTALTGGQSLYLPVMIALAVSAVGIMIAVKWVKRAKGAA